MQEWFDLLTNTDNWRWKIAATFLTIFLLEIIRKTVIRIVARRQDDPKVLFHWREGVTYSVYVIGLIVIWNVWIERIEQFGTIVGIVSAGLVIALKDPVVNLAGWAFIIIRRPFQVGDRVQIGEFRGDVIDIRLFQFTLNEIGNWVEADQSTGRIIHIPNGKVFVEMQANYSRGFKFIWNEIPVVITFESDWKKAKSILQDAVNRNTKDLSEAAEERLKEAAQKYMIFYSKLSPIVYTSVVDHGVRLTIRYLCNPQQRRGSEEDIWEEILDDFSQHKDIEFAYPTIRYFDNLKEGGEESEQ